MNSVRLFSLAFAVAVTTLAGCPPTVSEVSLDKKTLSIKKGDIATLTVSSTDSKDTFSWASSKTAFVSITFFSGRTATVVGKDLGVADVSVIGSHSGLSATTVVTVVAPPPGSEGEGETVAEGEGEGESILEGEGEAVTEGEGEGELILEGEGEAVTEGEGEGEGVQFFSHAGFLTNYAGASTCMVCHSSIADLYPRNEDGDVFASVHYQWRGATPELVNPEGEGRGVLTAYDDFDMTAPMNFSGLWTNQAGQPVDGGCVRCHVGLGALPSAISNPEQLENIDCLMCHSAQYERKLVDTDPTAEIVTPRFVPDESAMGTSLAQLDIDQRPFGGCLRCHAYAGGGPNLKRGDMDPELIDTTPDMDVHMASKAKGGAGLVCSSCHTALDHHIAGRGTDLSPTDVSAPVNCANCHPAQPHADAQLNRHVIHVNCTVCHIPDFARGKNPTEMNRNFAFLTFDLATGLYRPFTSRIAQDEVPQYRFWNRQSYVLGFDEPLRFNGKSQVILAEPLGTVQESTAQIFPFKVHVAYMPKLSDDSSMIGMKMDVIAQHGAKDNTNTLVMWNMTATDQQVVDAAIEAGAKESGLQDRLTTLDTRWTETERWMGIFHGVAPKTAALLCADCHGGTRLDFQALGYGLKQAQETLCATAACHTLRTGDFMTVHTQPSHQAMDCSTCHEFTRSAR